MKDSRNWLFLICTLLAMLCAYLYYLWQTKPGVTDITPYTDQIHKLDSANAISSREAEDALHRYDSLALVKQKTKIIYLEKYIFVHTANIGELDSIIRSASGLPPKKVLYH
jgi:hypothetical protein